MPYARNEDLPDQVTDNLPQGAQTIYREAFNSAFGHYDSPDKRRGDSDRGGDRTPGCLGCREKEIRQGWERRVETERR